MIVAGPAAPLMNAVLGGLRALKSELLTTVHHLQFLALFHVLFKPISGVVSNFVSFDQNVSVENFKSHF